MGTAHTSHSDLFFKGDPTSRDLSWICYGSGTSRTGCPGGNQNASSRRGREGCGGRAERRLGLLGREGRHATRIECLVAGTGGCRCSLGCGNGGTSVVICLTHTSFNCTALSVPAGSRAHLGPRSSSAHGPAERWALAPGAALSSWRPDAPSPLHLHGVLGSVLIRDLSAGPMLGASPALSHLSAQPPSKEVQPSPPHGKKPRLRGRSCWAARLTGAETGL